ARGALPGDCAPGERAAFPDLPDGACYLYVAHFNGEGWETRYIATLSQEDQPDWGGGGETLARLIARVSPNGRFLAFMSKEPLTGYDNEDAAAAGARDEEVFVYDATEHRITCASCNPGGARPSGVYDKERAGAGNGLLVDRAATWQENQTEEEGKAGARA